LVTVGSNEIVEQIIKQLHKLVDVVKVMDLNDYPHIEREMMLVKIDVQKSGACDVVKRISDIFRARIIDVGEKSYTVEVTGSRGKLDGFLQALHELRVVEVVRSGSMGIARGAVALHV
jgi:acetolactate synthase-1/3 small subunit